MARKFNFFGSNNLTITLLSSSNFLWTYTSTRSLISSQYSLVTAVNESNSKYIKMVFDEYQTSYWLWRTSSITFISVVYRNPSFQRTVHFRVRFARSPIEIPNKMVFLCKNTRKRYHLLFWFSLTPTFYLLP